MHDIDNPDISTDDVTLATLVRLRALLFRAGNPKRQALTRAMVCQVTNRHRIDYAMPVLETALSKSRVKVHAPTPEESQRGAIVSITDCRYLDLFRFGGE